MEYSANDIIVWAEFEVVAGLGFLLCQFGLSMKVSRENEVGWYGAF